MSSCSGGVGERKKYSFATSPPPGSAMATDKDPKRHAAGQDNGFAPLESRFIEIRDFSSGVVKQVPALDKRWVPSMNYIEFYLPSPKTLLEEEGSLIIWLDCMEMYCKDLSWLLSVPHHQFWSVMVYSPEVPQVVLQSFLLRAPQWFDKEFPTYLEHPVIGPKYQEIYSLVFRVFMRLCTFKESKKDFITPITWASLLSDHQILDILKLQGLCCLYDTESNTLLPKMIENVLKHCQKLQSTFRNLVPVLMQKSSDMTDQLRKKCLECSTTQTWDLEEINEMLSFFLSTSCGLYKFCKVYPPAAEMLLQFPNVLEKLAVTYEPNCCKLWGQVVAHLPMLEERVMLLRLLIIRLFRVTLAGPTINQTPEPKLDKYLEVLTHCLDEKYFIRDYEKLYPFKHDVNALLARGVNVDETTIDYVTNAISACIHACGEDYPVEKIVVEDPLYDPNFDRQLLGACSLDVTGVELESLVTQVKDTLYQPDLPDQYVEVVLKHYGYKAELVIDAMLEGSVPTHLDKYKRSKEEVEQKVPGFTDYSAFTATTLADDSDLERMASKLQIMDAEADGEKFYSGKRKYELEKGCDGISEEMKPVIKNLIGKMSEAEREYRPVESTGYIDSSLLPNVRHSLEYEDEYDDTYDELNVGMTEPDNMECQPLNQKKNHHQKQQEYDDEDSENEEEQKKKLDLYEDPAIVRARLERRREHKFSQRRGAPLPPSERDVVGKAKGQGQDKDVLYARRQKNINKDAGGFKKKRADFKRREF